MGALVSSSGTSLWAAVSWELLYAVCMCVCAHVCVCALCVCARVCVCVHVCMLCVYVCMCVHACGVYVCVLCMCVYVCMCVHACTCVCVICNVHLNVTYMYMQVDPSSLHVYKNEKPKKCNKM